MFGAKSLIWRDVVLSLVPPKATLVHTLAAIFAVEPSQVNLVAEVGAIASNYAVNCVLSQLPGEFPWLLSFYLGFEVEDDLAIVAQLCTAFACRALISNDENLDPCSMVLVEASRVIQVVSVDPGRLEKDEAYLLLGAAPHLYREPIA